MSGLILQSFNIYVDYTGFTKNLCSGCKGLKYFCSKLADYPALIVRKRAKRSCPEMRSTMLSYHSRLPIKFYLEHLIIAQRLWSQLDRNLQLKGLL